MKRELKRILTALAIGIFCAGCYGVLLDAVKLYGYAADPPKIYMVAPDAGTAFESILNCGNVAFASRVQAEAYSEKHPGSHVFELPVRQIK